MNAYYYPTPEEFVRQCREVERGNTPDYGVAHYENVAGDIGGELGWPDAYYFSTLDGALPPGGFVWVSHKGNCTYVHDMATPHLFYALRMLYNHSVPPVFRVCGAGEQIKRYSDVPYWDAAYRTEAIQALAAELDTRSDLPTNLLEQLADMQANTRVILRLGL